MQNKKGRPAGRPFKARYRRLSEETSAKTGLLLLRGLLDLAGELAEALAHPRGQQAGGLAVRLAGDLGQLLQRSEEPTSELQSLMRISYAVFCLKKKMTRNKYHSENIDIERSREPHQI